jgi:hypothetical protein
MTVPLPILQHGACEPFKAAVHGASLGLFALMGLYNAAAWVNRRERHLAVNAVIYCLGVAWEHRLVARHLSVCRAEAVAARTALTLVPPRPTDMCYDDRKVA